MGIFPRKLGSAGIMEKKHHETVFTSFSPVACFRPVLRPTARQPADEGLTDEIECLPQQIL